MPQTDQSWPDKSALTSRDVERALGGDALGRNGVLAPVPGTVREDRSLRVWLDRHGP